MVTYFDKDFCSASGCLYYNQEDLLCCSRNFKDPVDDMDAGCETTEIREKGFSALLDRTFS